MPSADCERRHILVVAGPGRSGTSLFAGLTSRLGLHIPQPEVSWNRSNPAGFSEPRWAVDFHGELLRQADVLVDDGRPEAWELADEVGRRPRSRAVLAAWLEEQLGISPRIVVKDPRLAWFLGLYRDAAAELDADLKVATMLRDPAEVLRSRELAYGTATSTNTRAIGWVNMMLGIERRTRDLPRATLAYSDLLAGWQDALACADESLGLGLVSGATDEQLRSAGDLVDPTLRRSAADWDDLGLHASVRGLVERTYEGCHGLIGVPADAQGPARDRLDELHEEFRAAYDEAAEIARHRTGATVRAERRKAIRKTRRELTAAEPPTRVARIRGRVSSMLRRS